MKIEEKSEHKFIVFDIKDIYPSISEALLFKAKKFAENLVNIKREDKVRSLGWKKTADYSM